jgi:phenylacetate-CoA ligase
LQPLGSSWYWYEGRPGMKTAGTLERFLAVVRAQDRPRAPDGMLWNREIEAADPDRRRALQNEKLAATYEYALEASPMLGDLYRRRGLGPGDVKSVDDLHKLPLFDDQDLRKDSVLHPPWGSYATLTEARWQESGWMVFASSGSTGKETPKLRRSTVHDRVIWTRIFERCLWAHGVRPGNFVMNMAPYGTSTFAWGMHEAALALGCPVLALSKGFTLKGAAAFVKSARPKVVIGAMHAVAGLGRELELMGANPADLGVSILVVGGEPGACIEGTRQRFSETWNARVHDDYGCTEAAPGPLGFTCEQAPPMGSADLHLHEDMYVVEILDPTTHKPVAEGEVGVIVVSNIHSDTSPYLRYNTGDYARLVSGPCACGRTSRRFAGGVLGRAEHCVTLGGTRVQRAVLEQVIRQIPGLGEEYLVVVDGESVNLTVECPRDLDAEDVKARLRAALNSPVSIETVDIGTLPRGIGKSDRFLSGPVAKRA